MDSTSVYWIDSGDLKKVSINGGPVTTLAAGLMKHSRMISNIILDAANIYWADSLEGVIMRLSINSGTVTTLASAQSVHFSRTNPILSP